MIVKWDFREPNVIRVAPHRSITPSTKSGASPMFWPSIDNGVINQRHPG